MPCETETVTVKVHYFVDATMSTINRFGPVCSQEAAEQLLLVLAARADVNKAVVVREIDEV